MNRGLDLFSNAISAGAEFLSKYTDLYTAFEQAQADVMKEFRYCQVCKRWHCQRDWDDGKKICANDSQEKTCHNCRKMVWMTGLQVVDFSVKPIVVAPGGSTITSLVRSVESDFPGVYLIEVVPDKKRERKKGVYFLLSACIRGWAEVRH